MDEEMGVEAQDLGETATDGMEPMTTESAPMSAPAQPAAPSTWRDGDSEFTAEEIRQWRESHENKGKWSSTNTQRSQEIARERKELQQMQEDIRRQYERIAMQGGQQSKANPDDDFDMDDFDPATQRMLKRLDAIEKANEQRFSQFGQVLDPLGKQLKEFQEKSKSEAEKAQIAQWRGHRDMLAKTFGVNSHELECNYHDPDYAEMTLEEIAAEMGKKAKAPALQMASKAAVPKSKSSFGGGGSPASSSTPATKKHKLGSEEFIAEMEQVVAARAKAAVG